MKIFNGQVIRIKKTEASNSRVIDALVLEFYKDPVNKGIVLTFANLQNLRLHTVLLKDNLKASFKSGKINYEILGTSSMKSVPTNEAIYGGFIVGDYYTLNTITYNKSKIEFSSVRVECVKELDGDYEFYNNQGIDFKYPNNTPCLVGRGEFGINVYYLSH